MQYGKLVKEDTTLPLWIIILSVLFLTSEVLLILSKSNEWQWPLSVSIPCIIAATLYMIMIRNHPSLWLIITSVLVFMIAGLVLLSIMNTDKWKWYISAFIPCIIVAVIYLHIFWKMPYLYFVVIWPWYYVFKKAPTNSLVKNVCILLPLAVFVCKTIFRIMEYFRLKGIIDNIGLSVGIIVNSERMRASVDIPPEMLKEQQFHLYSAISLFISIILYFLLERRLFSDLLRLRPRKSAIE